MIREKNGKFQLVSKKTGKVLGTHETRAGALGQERAIKASQKRRKK